MIDFVFLRGRVLLLEFQPFPSIRFMIRLNWSSRCQSITESINLSLIHLRDMWGAAYQNGRQRRTQDGGGGGAVYSENKRRKLY